MADKVEVNFDFSDAIKEQNKLIQGWKDFVKAEANARESVIKIDEEMNILSASLNSVDIAGNKIRTTFKTVDGVLKGTTVIVKDASNALEEQRAELEKLTAAKERAAAAEAKVQATAARRATLAGTNAVKFASSQTPESIVNATTAEKLAATRAIEDLRKLASQNALTVGQIRKVWADVAAGNIQQYSGTLLDLQTTIAGVQRAQSRLGAEFSKTDAQEKARQATQRHKEELKNLAEWQAETNRLQKEAREAVAKDTGDRAARFVTRTGRQGFLPTSAERAEVNKAAANLGNFVAKNKEAAAQLDRIWAEVRRGEIKQYTGALAILQQRLITVKNAQDRLGKSFDTQQTARLTAEMERAKRASNDLQISWQSIARIELFSLARRGLFLFISSVRQSLDTAAEFQVLISQIQTISEANVPFENWSAGLRRLSDSWGLDILDQARAAYEALSNQVSDGANTFLFLEQANKLALTGISTTAEAADLLAAAMNAYSLSVDDANRLSAIFFKTVDLGRVKIEDLANQFGRIGAPAASLGITIEELNAAIATLTIRGIKYSESATFLRGIIQKLIKPTDVMKGLFADIGVANAEAAIQTFGFAGFLEIIEQRTRGTSTELAELFNRVRAVTGAMILSGDGLDEYNDNLQQIIASSVDFDKKANDILETAGKNFQRELNQIKNIFVNDLAAPVLDGLKAMSAAGIDLSNLVKSTVTVLTYTLIPAVVVLLSQLRGIRDLAVTLRTNWKVAIATLAVQGFLYLATTARRTAREIAAAVEVVTTRMTEAALEQRARWSELAALVEQSYQRQSQAAAKSLALVIANFNKEADVAEAIFKNLNVAILDSVESTANALTKSANEAGSAYQTLQQQIESGKSNIINTLFSTDRTLFDFSLENLPSVAQIQLFEDRINKLRQDSVDAVQQADQATFAKLRQEIVDLLLRQKQVEEDSLDIVDLRIDKSAELKTLINEELTLQNELLRILEKQAAVEVDKESQFKLQQAGLDKLLEKYKNFDTSDLLKLTNPAEINARAGTQFETLRALIAEAKRLGTDPTAFQQEIDTLRPAIANRLQQLRDLKIQEDLRDVKEERVRLTQELADSTSDLTNKVINDLAVGLKFAELTDRLKQGALFGPDTKLSEIGFTKEQERTIIAISELFRSFETLNIDEQLEALKEIQNTLGSIITVPTELPIVDLTGKSQAFLDQIIAVAETFTPGGLFETRLRTLGEYQETIAQINKDAPTARAAAVQGLDDTINKSKQILDLRQRELDLLRLINTQSTIVPNRIQPPVFDPFIGPRQGPPSFNDFQPTVGPQQPNVNNSISLNVTVGPGTENASAEQGRAIFNVFMDEARRQGVRLTT